MAPAHTPTDVRTQTYAYTWARSQAHAHADAQARMHVLSLSLIHTSLNAYTWLLACLMRTHARTQPHTHSPARAQEPRAHRTNTHAQRARTRPNDKSAHVPAQPTHPYLLVDICAHGLCRHGAWAKPSATTHATPCVRHTVDSRTALSKRDGFSCLLRPVGNPAGAVARVHAARRRVAADLTAMVHTCANILFFLSPGA